ncbi:MAG: hypothetical protein EXR62_00125 [Chloroflexi bacterium]|nr:hypothetical protein [Chloroflexota bacterium]
MKRFLLISVLLLGLVCTACSDKQAIKVTPGIDAPPVIVTPATLGVSLKINDFNLDEDSRLTVSGYSTLPEGTILDVWLERGALNEPGAQRLSGWLGSGKVTGGHFQAFLNREGGEAFNAGVSYTAVVRAMLKGDLYQDAMRIPAALVQFQVAGSTQISGAVATVQPQNPQARALVEQLPPILVAASGSLPDSLAKSLIELAGREATGLLYLSAPRDAYLWQIQQPINAWLVRVAGKGETYLLWRKDSGVRYQQLEGMAPAAKDIIANGTNALGALPAPPRHLLAASSSQGPEIFIAADSAANRPSAEVWLLRISPDGASLKLVWHSSQMPRSWEGSDGWIDLVADNFDRFKLVGGLPADLTDAGRVFFEQGSFSKQRVASVWELVGDTYVRLTARVLPTPLTTLTAFIVTLRQKDIAQAAELVSSPSLVSLALKEGWDHAIPVDRLMARGGYSDHIDQPIEFWQGDNPDKATFKYQVTFLQRGGQWLIAAIEKTK